MIGSKSTALTLLTLTVSTVSSISCATGKDDDLLSIFGEQIDLETSHMNVKASSSVHLDRWLANYLAGKDAEAEAEWGKLIKDLRKQEDLYNVMKRALVRINFSDEKDNNPRRNNARAVQAMASASEKALGQSTIVLVGGYDFAANILDHSGKFTQAAIYKQREIALRRKFEPGSEMVHYANLELARYLLLNHQLTEARKIANEVRPALPKIKDQRVHAMFSDLLADLSAKTKLPNR